MLYLVGCKKEQVTLNQRIMTAVTEAAKGKKTQGQKMLEEWPVAKVPQWSRQGLMEHFIELVVVDDQVRKYIYVMSTHVQLVCDTLQAFSLVDCAAFHCLLMYQCPNTQDTDIPHCTSVAKAIHEKVYKVTNILKDLFAVSLLDLSHSCLACISTLEDPWGGICNVGQLVFTSP